MFVALRWVWLQKRTVIVYIWTTVETEDVLQQGKFKKNETS